MYYLIIDTDYSAFSRKRKPSYRSFSLCLFGFGWRLNARDQLMNEIYIYHASLFLFFSYFYPREHIIIFLSGPKYPAFSFSRSSRTIVAFIVAMFEILLNY